MLNFYQGFLSFKGKRGRLSFLGALITLFVMTVLVVMITNIFISTDATMFLGSMFFGLVVMSVLTIPVMIQRIRHCVGTDNFKIIVLFLLSFLPFVSLIWFVYPGKGR
tara:strand:- start:308 stop:631 length:324 start_codon:yes stop_codon:yes gene_type:complete